MTHDPIRVLWLIRGLGPGGAERLLVAHAAAGSDGFDYQASYQVAAKDQLVPELEELGVPCRHLAGGARWAPALRQLVLDERIDVVHSHSPAVAVGARLALRSIGRARRPRHVYTEHNRWDAYRLPTRLANAATLALDDEVFAVSEEARGSVAARLRPRVTTLHHGVDRDQVRAAAAPRAETRAALGIPDEHVVAVQVANYRTEKAHEVLVDAAERLRRRDDLTFLLVGQGPRQEEITALVRARGLEDRVRILGFRTDVASLLAAGDALVLSSDHEGLPVAVMEALALGVPVVSTAVGGIPEAIDHEVEGLLVPPRDPAALAAAVARIADDGALRGRLGTAARARSAQFDAATATATIEAAYRAVLGR